MNVTAFQRSFLDASNAETLQEAAGEWRVVGIVEGEKAYQLKLQNIFTNAVLLAGETQVKQVEVEGTQLEGAHLALRNFKKLEKDSLASAGEKLADLAKAQEWVTPREAEFIKSTHGQRALTKRQKARRAQINAQIVARRKIQISGPRGGIQKTRRLKQGSLAPIRANHRAFIPASAVQLAVQHMILNEKDASFYNGMRRKDPATLSAKQWGYVEGLNAAMLRNAHQIEAQSK
ncbi:MAG: hypothetical protein KDK48_03160 [Chlamydiia bacterium]|nr:hypothetical protein [Chlamydiia bacterium]